MRSMPELYLAKAYTVIHGGTFLESLDVGKYMFIAACGGTGGDITFNMGTLITRQAAILQGYGTRCIVEVRYIELSSPESVGYTVGDGLECVSIVFKL